MQVSPLSGQTLDQVMPSVDQAKDIDLRASFFCLWQCYSLISRAIITHTLLLNKYIQGNCHQEEAHVLERG